MSVEINYSSLVEEVKSLAKEEVKTEKTTAKKKPTVSYEVSNVSGVDMIVRKKTAKTDNIMVFLISQQKIFIKNMLSGEIKEVTNTDFSSFFKDLPNDFKWEDEEGNKPVWLGSLGRTALQCNVLFKIISNKELLPWLKSGYLTVNFKDFATETSVKINTANYPFKDFVKILKYVPEKYFPALRVTMENRLVYGQTYSYYRQDNDPADWTKITSLVAYLAHREPFNHPIEEKYGFDGLRQCVEAYFNSQVSYFPSQEELADLLSNNKSPYHWRNVKSRAPIDFDFKSFVDYVFNSSVKQGYANDIDNFISSWTDDLFMQTYLFKHGVKDKYPEYLASHEKLIAYKYNLVKQEIDQKMFEEASAKMSKFNKYGEKYIIISPECPNDMIEEARQQSNCLASYVKRVLHGELMIFFLRLKENPEESLVTIEIRGDYRLGQVKQKFNREASSEEREFVEKWWKEKFEKLYNSTANM